MKITEIAVYYRESQKTREKEKQDLTHLKDEIINLLKMLINSAVLKTRFYTKQLYRLNYNLYPIEDLLLFEDKAVFPIKNTYRMPKDRIGSLLTFIDFRDYRDIDNSVMKLKKFNSWVIPIIEEYLKFYSIDFNDLITAFYRIEQNDFYVDTSKRYLNNNTELWLERKIDYYNFIFRIVLLNLNSNVIHKIDIPIKNKNESEKISPRTWNFTVIGWKKGNIFHFQWGEEEKYEFRANEMKLYLNGKEVNGE